MGVRRGVDHLALLVTLGEGALVFSLGQQLVVAVFPVFLEVQHIGATQGPCQEECFSVLQDGEMFTIFLACIDPVLQAYAIR